MPMISLEEFRTKNRQLIKNATAIDLIVSLTLIFSLFLTIQLLILTGKQLLIFLPFLTTLPLILTRKQQKILPFERIHSFKMDFSFFRKFQIFCEPLSKRNHIYYCQEKNLYIGWIRIFNDKKRVITIYTPERNICFSQKNIKKIADFFHMRVQGYYSNDFGNLLILTRTRKTIELYLTAHTLDPETEKWKDIYQQQKLFYEFMDDSIGDFSNSDKIS